MVAVFYPPRCAGAVTGTYQAVDSVEKVPQVYARMGSAGQESVKETQRPPGGQLVGAAQVVYAWLSTSSAMAVSESALTFTVRL